MQRGKAEWSNNMKQEGLDDMTLLSKVTNDQILDNLRKRYDNDIIYTSIGDVLISVNPFKMIDIYGSEMLQEYVGRSRIELPPHVFAVAESAYRAMVNDKENQCVIISGESGAGKTEAAKKIMQYIAEVSGNTGKPSQGVEHVKRIILETNPLLEAFGNAKTLRNNNSSRFGKYFEIQFNEKGEPDGGKITNYLLEKSRIVFQTNGERNFHIFYQMCKGATAKEREDFGIYEPENFAYLTKGNCLEVDGMDDVEEWGLTRNAMNVIGISEKEQANIFRLLSAILWLGNVDFVEKGEEATVADQSVLDFVCNLLGVPAQFLKTALEVRQMETKHGNNRGTQYKVPLNRTQALAGRDGLSKAIYDRLFTWLVERINTAMEKKNTGAVIGVLDIYGFEVFDKNGFEQLCINYVNEKLQQIFIEFTLKAEQEEYVKEGIKWEPIQYFDNKIVCDLIEGKAPPGVFAVLDDVSKSVHSQSEGADKALIQRIAGLSSNAHFDMRGAAFCVKHYAGDVTYEAAGIIEKNKDTLLKDHLETLQMTDNELLLTLFPDSVDPSDKKLPSTAGFKIKSSAADLVTALKKCTPHYIRCLKPNDQKIANHFENPRVMHQIKYLGLLDNIKVRRAGFAFRTLFAKFLSRYYLLSKETCYAGQNIWKGDPTSGCLAIVKASHVESTQYQIGKTKVFIRLPETLFALEEMRERYWHNMVSRIKNAFRNFIAFKASCSNRIKYAYRTYKQYRIKCAQTLQGYWRAYKAMSPYADIRMKNEQLFQGKKERQRFSVTSVRRYYGDYLDMKSQHDLLTAMGNAAASEKVLFSSKAQTIAHPVIRSNKVSPRFLCVTQQAIYLIKVKKDKNILVHILDRRVPISSVQSFSLSPYNDNFVIIHCVGEEVWDVALCLDFKTELVATINQAKGSPCSVNFNATIEYQKKKGKNNSIEFLKDEAALQKAAPGSKEAFFKKDKILCPSGLPASTPVAKVRKNAKVQPVQPRKQDKPAGHAKPAAAAKPAAGGLKKAPAAAAPAAPVAKKPAAVAGAPAPAGAKAMPSKPMGKPVAKAAPGAAGAAGQPRPVSAKPKAAAKPAAAAPAKPRYKALYEYDAVEPDELTFREGDVITLSKKVDADWWEGVLNGKTGMFPANYVEELK
eukprot:TRINITY_DN5735_c1_g3_i1.p1 TRINITY_DN5735_c1_g3~~TRINITY_DN5735_c1_g3_i1.p1  ORF type:complete len:1138 (+),score=396.14 TRINITY_DN5735_c1_g3_i1:202-3615(+)